MKVGDNEGVGLPNYSSYIKLHVYILLLSWIQLRAFQNLSNLESFQKKETSIDTFAIIEKGR